MATVQSRQMLVRNHKLEIKPLECGVTLSAPVEGAARLNADLMFYQQSLSQSYSSPLCLYLTIRSRAQHRRLSRRWTKLREQICWKGLLWCVDYLGSVRALWHTWKGSREVGESCLLAVLELDHKGAGRDTSCNEQAQMRRADNLSSEAFHGLSILLCSPMLKPTLPVQWAPPSSTSGITKGKAFRCLLFSLTQQVKCTKAGCYTGETEAGGALVRGQPRIQGRNLSWNLSANQPTNSHKRKTHNLKSKLEATPLV